MRRCGPEAIVTFVGGGLERAETRLADYDRSSGKFLRFLEGTSGMQPGDPVKAAQAIVAAVESESPLLRLILKRYALPFCAFRGAARRKMRRPRWKSCGPGCADFLPATIRRGRLIPLRRNEVLIRIKPGRE